MSSPSPASSGLWPRGTSVASQIVGSSFANAAQLPNYVNGRLLAAEDLATGQATLCQRDRWDGQAAGTGVVSGLWVTNTTANTLTVATGFGITPSGEPVSVPTQVNLALSIAAAATPATGVRFTNCCTTAGGAQSGVTSGAYLLTALPACQLQGQAALASQPGSNTPPAAPPSGRSRGCSSKPSNYRWERRGRRSTGSR